jgi:uncharacterized membrane protein
MIVNVSALVIFIVASIVRAKEISAVVPFILSIAGIVLISFGGWLGGELVYVKGMAVEPVEELAEERDQESGPETRLRRVS